MRRQKDFLRRMWCILVVITIVFPSFVDIGINAEAAVYSTNGTNIIYDGEGEIQKKLDNGKQANVTVKDSVINITVAGERYGYYSQICVATCVIADDDLLHIFWHTGDYYVYDLYESGMFIRAYKNSNTQMYCSEDASDSYLVMGSSAANVSFHSCIIDGKYFYQYGKTGKKALMTRLEFNKIVNPQEATPTPTIIPTPTPTQVPTPTPTQVPTPTPTQVPTPTPTQVPTPTPTLVPTATPVIEVNTQIDFNFQFWWEFYVNGTITWEQFKEIMWEYHWTSNTKVTENSTTYYFYDEEGRLIREETITISNKNESGTGGGTVEETTKGEADIDIDVSGKGEVNGEISAETDIFINTPIPVVVTTAPAVTKAPQLSVSKKVVVIEAGKSKTITYSAKNSGGKAVKAKVSNSSNVATAKVISKTKLKITASKKAANCTYTTCIVKNGSKTVEITVIISKTVKKHARVVTSGNRIKLFTKKNSLHGWLLYDKKKGTMDWNGYKLSGVKSCGYIQGSWNVIVLMNNGKVYKISRPKKGETIHKTEIKCSEKAIALNRDSYGFVKVVKLECGGAKNVSGL